MEQTYYGDTQDENAEAEPIQIIEGNNLYQSTWQNIKVYVWIFWGVQLLYRIYISHLVYGYYVRLQRGEHLITENSPCMLDMAMKRLRA